MRSRKDLGGLLVLGVALAAPGGCLTQLAANSTARIMNRASPALQAQADPGIAEDALPYSIAQMEGLLLVIPNNGGLRVNCARAYAAYGFGFLEDRMEQAELDEDEARTEHYRERASGVYLRAKALGLEQLGREEDGDGGALGAYRRGIDAWNEYLQRFDDQDQAAMLFWTGYAWARYINLHKDDMNALADLPFAVALFERTLQVDPSFNYHAPHAAMAAYYAGRPAALGGQPDAARREFETAINNTQRKFLTYQMLMARYYAVMVQDRALFQRLLQEVIDAGDVWPEQRLANQLAKRRARRYLAQIDTLFDPSTAAASTETPAAGEAAPESAPAPAPAPAAATP